MPTQISTSGSLEENSLPRILNYLREINGTGTLVLTRGGITKQLFFKNGGIVFASSSYDDDRLGEILLKAGKISVQQYENATKVLKQTGKRMGGVMVELGYLTAKDLFWGVKHQVQEIVCSLFEWTEGQYDFRSGEVPPAEVITLHMSTPNLIVQGVKRIEDWTRISRGIPKMDSVLKVTSDPLKLYQDVSMSKEERLIISLFDGKRTIKEVFDKADMPDFDALKAVYVYYTIGMLDTAGPDDAAQASPRSAQALGPSGTGPKPLDKTAIHKAYIDSKSQDYYELLKIDSDATPADVEAAYQRLAKLYHPDQQFREGMEQLKNELDELIERITNARDILTDDARRWEYDLSISMPSGLQDAEQPKKVRKPKDPAKAREAFAKGVDSFRVKDLESATVHFKEAARLDNTNASYFSHLALALLQRPRREAEAEEAMLEAVALEPDNADHRANLGLLYKRAGIMDKARESFREALRIDPKNPKALKGLGIK